MIIEEEVARYAAQARGSAKASIETFFDKWQLDRTSFEAMIDRLTQKAGPIFYVSTVARGLAGSTSDIDVIVPSQSGARPLGNWLFHGDRRVGARVIAEDDLGRSLALVASAVSGPPSDALQSVGAAAPLLPVKWMDLERIVNGYSFEAGVSYAAHLPDISKWALATSLASYARERVLWDLARTAGRDRAAHVYGMSALIWAMEALMAACGRVQSNTKWTFERWARFRPEVKVRTAREGRDILDRVLASIRTTPLTAPPELFEDIDAFLMSAFPGARSPTWPGLALSPTAKTAAFLPDAVFVGDDRRTAVVAADHLAALNAEAAHPAQAATWLSFLQFGLGRLREPEAQQ